MESIMDLGVLSPVKLAIAEERLRHPAPGSQIEAARNAGVDLSLLIAQLRLTPSERAIRMHSLCVLAEEVRGAAKRRRR